MLYAMVGQVKVKRGETKRGLHRWLEKLDGESVLRARCLRYLCDRSYVSGSEIKQERGRRRTAKRSGAWALQSPSPSPWWAVPSSRCEVLPKTKTQ